MTKGKNRKMTRARIFLSFLLVGLHLVPAISGRKLAQTETGESNSKTTIFELLPKKCNHTNEFAPEWAKDKIPVFALKHILAARRNQESLDETPTLVWVRRICTFSSIFFLMLLWCIAAPERFSTGLYKFVLDNEKTKVDLTILAPLETRKERAIKSRPVAHLSGSRVQPRSEDGEEEAISRSRASKKRAANDGKSNLSFSLVLFAFSGTVCVLSAYYFRKEKNVEKEKPDNCNSSNNSTKLSLEKNEKSKLNNRRHLVEKRRLISEQCRL
ncbi:unnamed protein product [Amoebophrya sp. A120]|nr:unnamed protein product [Amoebophrya sp. A120]|eukprot:GSA120T00003563001.1